MVSGKQGVNPASTGVQAWYEANYGEAGFESQRRYPNEELCRFMGRHFFRVPADRRKDVRILEAGCGSGANLWMIAREGFDAWGLDFSETSIALCRQMMERHGVSATLAVGDMAAMDYPPASFDAIVDVFSSYCLDDRGHAAFLDGVARLLRPGGRFFTYTPGKGSSDWKGPDNVVPTPGSALVYPNNRYPFRYTTIEELSADLARRGIAVTAGETVRRTYANDTVLFEFVVVEGLLGGAAGRERGAAST